MHCVISYPPFSKNRAFTLIELSIVLVVIGLIMGGVLVGMDMIKAASMRAQVTQVEQNTDRGDDISREIYCIPGDCAAATSFFSGVSNGNGDGKICRKTVSALDACSTAHTNNAVRFASGNAIEISSVFDHLATAGLVNLEPYDETVSASNLAGVGYPKMKFQGSGT